MSRATGVLISALIAPSALAAGVAAAAAAGLVASVDAATGSQGTTVLVSGRPAVIVSTLRLAEAGAGCDAQALGPGTIAAQAPQLAVTGAARERAAVVVTLTADLPGTAVRVPGAAAFAAFFSESHALGRTGRGLLDLLHPDRTDQVVAGSVDFDARGRGCLRVSDPRHRSRLRYHLAVRWNRELGARPITRPGTVRIAARPTSRDARACAAAFAADPATRRPEARR